MWNGKDEVFEAYASLRIYGQGLPPAEISERLTLEPSRLLHSKPRLVALLAERWLQLGRSTHPEPITMNRFGQFHELLDVERLDQKRICPQFIRTVYVPDVL